MTALSQTQLLSTFVIRGVFMRPNPTLLENGFKMTGQTPRDFPPYLDVIWFDNDDSVHYGTVAGWGMGLVIVNENQTLVPVPPEMLYYF